MSNNFSQEDFFYVFTSTSLCDNMCLQWLGHVWPQRHKLNKFGRSPLDDNTYQGLVVSGKIFNMFSLYKPMLNM